MKLSEELIWRGQIKDKTFDSISWLDKPKTFYLGTDCSSDSLTIGNLAIYMMARRLRKHSWKAVLLVGGATSLIGDPGGKDEERELKSREEIQANVASIKKQVDKLFAGMDFTLVDNYDWFKDMNYLEFLRDVGKHYSMTELLGRDFIKARIGKEGTGISYAEFSYSLIQGYDFWHLFRKHHVELQIGGSDQWGNMLSGVPLIRKKEAKEVHAMSMPLVIDNTSGKKFGKSEAGAVWLDPQKTSSNDFHQFWLNTSDENVEDYLKIFTELDKEEIANVMKEFEKNKSSRLAQIKLADEVTVIVHGKEAVRQAKEHATTISSSTSSTSTSSSTTSTTTTTTTVPPHIPISKDRDIVSALVSSGLASSKTEARQLIKSGGVYINGKQTKKENFDLEDAQDGLIKLRRGKTLKNTVIIRLN